MEQGEKRSKTKKFHRRAGGDFQNNLYSLKCFHVICFYRGSGDAIKRGFFGSISKICFKDSTKMGFVKTSHIKNTIIY